MVAFLFNLDIQTKGELKIFLPKLPRKLGIHIISEKISSVLLILCNQWCPFEKVSLRMAQRFRAASGQRVCVYCKGPPSSAVPHSFWTLAVLGALFRGADF